MDTLIRAARVLLIVVLAVLAVSCVVGLARPETGAVDKVGLAVLFAACVIVAARVTDWATRLRERVSTHQTVR
jgi:hypothetical protein